MTITCAELADLPVILDLQKLCYRENAERYGDYAIPPLVQTISELETEFRDGVILKAVDGLEIVGSVRACERDKTCYIGRLIVHPDYQNRGIGTKLMVEIERIFPECDRFELFTGHRDEKNLYLYGKLGYRVFKEESHNGKVKFVFLEKLRS